MLTMEDLNALDVASRTVKVTVGGLELEVRGVSAAEMDEIDALLPMPAPPLVERNGRSFRDDQDPDYLERCEAVAMKRRALLAGVAAGFTCGEHAWTREDLGGRRPPPANRTTGPNVARREYAERAVPLLIKHLGYATIIEIINASHRAETGGAAGGDDAGKP